MSTGLAAVGVGVMGTALAVTANAALKIVAPAGPAQSVKAMAPVVAATGGFIALHYFVLFMQSFTGFSVAKSVRDAARKKGEELPSPVKSLRDVKYSSAYTTHPDMLQANRTVGNHMEQMVPFLLSLYGHALLVDPNRAALFGWAWIFFRACYYPLFRRGPVLLLSTLPAYALTWWMAGTSVWAAVHL